MRLCCGTKLIHHLTNPRIAMRCGRSAWSGLFSRPLSVSSKGRFRVFRGQDFHFPVSPLSRHPPPPAVMVKISTSPYLPHPSEAEDEVLDEAARKPTSKPHSVSPCLRALRVNRPEAGGVGGRSVRHAPRAARVHCAPGQLCHSPQDCTIHPRTVPFTPGRTRRRRRCADRRRRAFPSRWRGGRVRAAVQGRTAPS